jgi:hypothetical protein
MSDSQVIGIDTMCLIWGVRDRERITSGDASQKERDGLRKTNILFENCDSAGASLVISSLSVAELLVPVPRDKHAELIQILVKLFDIVDYAYECASDSALLYAKHSSELRTVGKPGDRDHIKNDINIISSFRKYGVHLFYTDDGRARTIASSFGLKACKLPEMSERLFDTGPRVKRTKKNRRRDNES